MEKFNYNQDFSTINFRDHPELYQIGRGEQGVLLVETYKSELLPYWHFKTHNIAEQSAKQLHQCFEQYRQQDDFVGMDMARKFIQMGYTRARRYANHPGGRKYAKDKSELPYQLDKEKAQAAAIFKDYWDKIRADSDYLARQKQHQQQYG